jgi:hypothetical protein
MPFEEFDKKIKEASEHYHPAYDEIAWKKMNQLLDEQLPGKKDDWRRIYYFLFLLIFVTAGGYLLIEKPWNSNNKIYPVKNSISTNSNPVTNPATIKKNKTSGNNNDIGITLDQVGNSRSIPLKQPNFISPSRNNPAGKGLISFDNKSRIPSDIFKNKINAIITGDKNAYGINKDKLPDVKTDAKNDIGNQKQRQIDAGNTVLPGTKDISDNNNDVKETTIESLPEVQLAKTKSKNQKNFIRNLALTISAGPDISAFNSSEPGKTTLYYGVGLRYDITKRVTVRSGFYITDKIYSAAGKDYKQTYSSYPTFTLTSVDADCKIFEIPMIVNYNIIQRKKNNFFGSIGLSSFLMNRETYHYHYNDSWGQYRYGANTVNNKNQHYFSVVTLTTGYERKLNHIFSLIAEPYVKLPLAGIGEGRIKLNSAGLLVSVSVKPFAVKEQKK